MTELPPPPPGSAPSTPASTGSQGSSSVGRGESSGSDWDWDRVRDLAETWFRPLTEPRGWLALLYLFGSLVAAPFLFAAMVAVASVSFALAFIVVGIFLIVPFFRMTEAFVEVERWLAEFAGHEIELREPTPVDGVGLTSIRTVMTDPVRWRQVGFVAANLILAAVLYAIGSFPLSVTMQAVFGGWAFGGPFFGFGGNYSSIGILALPIGAFAAGAIPRVAIWVADLKFQIDNWFVGTDRLAAAEERVSTLAEQRQDILDAVASERRRIERNLHDGVQQQLVAIGLDLGMAEHQLEGDPDRARELIVSAREKVQGSIGELRQLGRGLHPAILEDRGIDAALSAVVSSAPIPVSVQVDPDLELSTDVAETVYFVANEAIANVLKHAKARVASIHVTRVGPDVRVTVHDDGVGGADASRGTGLAGIRARVHAVDGTFTVTSPEGGPTTLIAEFARDIARNAG